MPKYIISWDAGYGDIHEVIEAKNNDEALEVAYEQWKEEAETNAIYRAEPYTEELADEHGL